MSGDNCVLEKSFPSPRLELLEFAGLDHPYGLYKVNTDGGALGNHRRFCAGGILRDCYRDLIHAFASPMGVGTVNQSELEETCIGFYLVV